MLTLHISLAVLAVGALARHPASPRSAFAVAAAAVIAVATGAPLSPAFAVVAPLVAFLSAAMTLAVLVERSGLAERAADALAVRARGSSARLYVLACGVCAALTAVVSLDAAVVLMVPLVRRLARRCDLPFRPLFLGVVSVANAASVAVPQGNPANLVVIDRLGISPTAFTAHMLAPGMAAAALCAAVVATGQRGALRGGYRVPAPRRTPLPAHERSALLALAGAGLVAWICPLAGVAPWWPFAATVALVLLASPERPRVVVPARLAVQVCGLMLIMQSLDLRITAHPGDALPGLIVVTFAVGASAALANNLPVSVCAATLLAGPSAYAATIGLGVGSLATPHGSVATLIATDLAGGDAPPLSTRQLAPLATAAVLAAIVALAVVP